jgi:hypothetical protein
MNKRSRNNNKDDGNKNNNKKKRKITITPPEKKNENNDLDKFYTLLFHSISGSNENYEKECKKLNYESDGYSDDEENDLILGKDNITLDDLISWGYIYHRERKKYSNGINLKTLWRIQRTLLKLKEMVGMETVKKNIVEQIVYYLQHLEIDNNDMLHTIIEGPPGVGKTELGKILGELYVRMGILKNENVNIDDPDFNIDSIFKIVKRSDLIGKYLGHTAAKTQEVIDSCKGGVMFIDEAYSLGNEEKRDTFSKECIDTINRNLSELKSNFLCIIAGYPGDMDKCFFAYNAGLKRRFPFKYTVEKYTASELREIFKIKVHKLGWYITDESLPIDFFNKNLYAFPHFGGDIETLLLNCKLQHGIRVFGKSRNEKRVLVYDDIKNGFNKYLLNKQILDNKTNNLYV